MTRPAPIIAAVLLLLPVLYVGSYLALVDPPYASSASYRRWAWRENADYRCDTRLAGVAFWPWRR
jgi:hypothetical protein